jgi:hypothetical protein
MALGKLAVALLGLGAVYAALPTLRAKAVPTFDQPAETAVERLQSKSRVVEGTGMGSLTIASAGTDQDKLLIGVTRAGDPRTVKCRVEVTAVSPVKSRADVDCSQPAAPDRPMRQVASDALAIVVREHVAATIEDRPYDVDRVADRLMAFLVTSRPAIATALSPPRK